MDNLFIQSIRRDISSWVPFQPGRENNSLKKSSAMKALVLSPALRLSDFLRFWTSDPDPSKELASWIIFGPQRRHACQMIKATEHHILEAVMSSNHGSFWSSERSVTGFLGSPFLFRQPFVAKPDYPLLDHHVCKHLAISNIQRHRHNGFQILWICYNTIFMLFSPCLSKSYWHLFDFPKLNRITIK